MSTRALTPHQAILLATVTNLAGALVGTAVAATIAHGLVDARFITPRMQQTFKWYAGRSEVCAWKDIPQDAAGLVAWWDLFRELYPRAVNRAGLAIHGEPRLQELAAEHGATYVVIDRTKSRRQLLLPRVYPTDVLQVSNYEVYRFPDR